MSEANIQKNRRMSLRKRTKDFNFNKSKNKSDKALPLKLTAQNARQKKTGIESSRFNRKNVRCKSSERNEEETKSKMLKNIEIDCSENSNKNFSSQSVNNLIPKMNVRKKNLSDISENTLDDAAQRCLRNRSRIFKPKKYTSFVNTLEVLANIDKRGFKKYRKTETLDEVPNFGNANSAEHLQKLLNCGSIKISEIGFLNKSYFNPSVNVIPLAGNGELSLNSSPVAAKRKTEHETADSSHNKRLKSCNFLQKNASHGIIKDVIYHNMKVNKSKKTLLNSTAIKGARAKMTDHVFYSNIYSVHNRQKFLEAISFYIDDKKVNYQNNVMHDKSPVKCPHRLLTVTSIFKPTSSILRCDRQETDTENENSQSPDSVLVSPSKDVAGSDASSKDSAVNSIEKHTRYKDCKECVEAFEIEEYLLRTLYNRFCNEIPSEIFNEIKKRKKSILKRILLQKWDMKQKLDVLFVILANGTIAAFFGAKKEAFLSIALKKRFKMCGNFKLSKNGEYRNMKSCEKSSGKILEMAVLKRSVVVPPSRPSNLKGPYEKCTKLLVSHPAEKLLKQSHTVSVAAECQTKAKKTQTKILIVDWPAKNEKNKSNLHVPVDCQTKQNKPKTDDVGPNLEDRASVLLHKNGSNQIFLPDSIQMVECSLPVTEATNCTTLQKTCVFRQIFKSFDSLIQCFFCKNKLELLYLYTPLHLKMHYVSKHHLSVHMYAAKFDTGSEFVTMPSKQIDDAVLDHACVYCKSRLKTRADVNQHYSDVHKKTAVLVSEEEIASLEQLIYCSLCNHPSENLLSHHLHMGQEHALQTYSCRFCYFCTYEFTNLMIHLRKIHGEEFRCTLCCKYLQTRQHMRKHILLCHAVKTGSNEWFCTTCLDSFKNLETLEIHGRMCIEKRTLSSKSSKEGIDCCTTDVSCKNDALTVNPEEHADEKIANIDKKHACFACDMSFSTFDVYKEHIHHVHKQWVKEKKGTTKVAIDSPKKCAGENEETTPNTQKSCINYQVTMSTIEKNLDCVVYNDEHSENNAESLTSRLSSAEVSGRGELDSKLNISSQSSTQAEGISNSTNGCLENKSLNTLSAVCENDTDSQDDYVSFSSLPDDKQLSKIGFPKKFGHFCRICNIVIQNYRLYYMHMHNFHQHKKMFKCIISSCRKIFNVFSEFEAHASEHSQKYYFFCCLCDIAYADADKGKEHLLGPYHQLLESKKIKERNGGNYCCKVCFTRFYSCQAFVNHMEADSHKYACHTCNSTFIQPHQRRRHIERHHVELANTCEECGMQFPDARSVLKHFEVHEFIFECSLCGAEFFQKEQYDIHVKIHGKQLLCPVRGCKQWFTFGVLHYYLFFHLRKYHKLFQDLRCPKCLQVFKNDIGLYRHWTFVDNTIKCKDGGVISVNSVEKKRVSQWKKILPKPSASELKANESAVKTFRTNEDLHVNIFDVEECRKLAEANKDIDFSTIMETMTKTQKTTEKSIPLNYNMTVELLASKKSTSAKLIVNADNNVMTTTPSNGYLASSTKLPQIVKLHKRQTLVGHPTNVLMFKVSRALTDKSESLNSLETVDANNKTQLIVRSTQNPTTEPISLNESIKLKCIPSEKSTKTDQGIQFIQSNVDKNLPVVTIKQEPVEEPIQLEENMALKFIPLEKPTKRDEDMQTIESDVDKNLPVLTVKQEPIEEPIQFDESRMLRLEPSAKSSEVGETLQVLTVKQEPTEESIEPHGGTAIEDSTHLTVNQKIDAVNQKQMNKSVVVEESIRAIQNVLDLQFNFNKQIPAQIEKTTEQSISSNNLEMSVLQSAQQNLNINQLDEAGVQPENTFMHIPADMIQLACAGCLCMFESKDQFFDHVCTGQVADDAAGQIVVLPQEGSDTCAVEWVGQATVPEQLCATNHPAFSEASIFQSQTSDQVTMLPFVKHYLGGQIQIVPTDNKTS